MFQFINSEGDIVLSKDFEDNLLHDFAVNAGSSYNVVAILGSQGSGKSTLLNHWFKSEFEVMNAQLGHRRTTRGVWAAIKTSGNIPTIILDVEGTDSKDGNQDNLTYEHRTALFSLTVADCLIINIPYQSLGNFVGSGYSILKTVMEANLELAQQALKPEKTTLLFTVRDWISNSSFVTPKRIIQEQIEENYVKKIWLSIHKPENYTNTSVTDIFDIKVFCLEHAILKPERFNEDVENLNSLWKLNLRPKTYSKEIVMNNWINYSKSIWTKIMDSKELDIPSVTTMISLTKCRESMNSVLEKALKEIEVESVKVSKAETDRFTSWSENLLKKYIEEYQSSTYRHRKSCSEVVEEELKEVIIAKVSEIANLQFNHVVNRLFSTYSNKIKEHFVKDMPAEILTIIGSELESIFISNCSNFGKYSEEISFQALNEFDTIVLNHSIYFLDKTYNFSGTTFSANFEKQLDSFVTKLNEQQIAAFDKYLKQAIKKEMAPIKKKISISASKATDFWKEANLLISSIPITLKTLYFPWLGLFQNFKSEIDFKHFVKDCRKIAVLQLVTIVSKMNENLEKLVTERFRENFNPMKNKNKNWSEMTEQEINQFFLEAQADAIAWVNTLFKFDISFEDTNIQASEQSSITQQLTDEANKEKVLESCLKKNQELLTNALAIKSSSASKWSQIPFLFWVILFIFGFNEIVASIGLFFSPYFILAAVLIGTAYAYTRTLRISQNAPIFTVSVFLMEMINALISMINKYSQRIFS